MIYITHLVLPNLSLNNTLRLSSGAIIYYGFHTAYLGGGNSPNIAFVAQLVDFVSLAPQRPMVMFVLVLGFRGPSCLKIRNTCVILS